MNALAVADSVIIPVVPKYLDAKGLKQLRKEAGLRQEDLAKELNVSRQTIIAIENDKYDPTLELAMKLA